MAEISNKKPYSVSFIVPALNEQDVVGKVVRDIWQNVDALVQTYEIILIDDGSTDATGQVMDALAKELPNIRVIHNRPNKGLGTSYQIGVAEAKLDYVMLLCGDGGLPASSLPPIIEQIGSADIVVPYMRNLKRIKTPRRYILSRTYTTILNIVFGQSLRYYNGLPVHRRDLLNQIQVVSSGFGFQAEILIKLLRSGCTYVEVGVDGAEQTSRSSALRLSNVISVAKTFFSLIRELRGFKMAIARTPTPR